MAKVMLVEDDNNLREIYEARLLAEGYDIVSAQDGEEALALAVKEKPDLIIADIMMPKISGFDMLDILRSTPETRDTKVVMMTALSQAEDKERANKLGADRYLVKSQVTLEDVARVAREVLEGKAGPDAASLAVPAAAAPAAGPVPVTPVAAPPAAPDPAPQPIAVAAPPAPAPTPAVAVPPQAAPTSQPTDPATSNNAVLDNAMRTVGNPTAGAAIPEDVPSGGLPNNDNQQTAVHTKVINPINDISQSGVNLEALVAKEEANENAMSQAQGFNPNQAVVNNMDPNQPAPAPQAPAQPPNPSDPNSIAL